MSLEPADEMRAGYLLGCVLETRGKIDDALRTFYEIMQKDLHYVDVQTRYVRLKARAARDSPPGDERSRAACRAP